MRIALFVPNWIGDAVMATPAIRAIRERYPDAHLIGVGRSYVEGALEGAPWFNEWISLDPRGPRSHRPLNAIRSLRRQPIDIAVLFPNSFRSALVARLAGCRQRIGFARYGRSLFLTDRLAPVCDSRGRIVPAPILLDYNRLAERAGARVGSLRLELATTPVDELHADRIWHRHDFRNRTDVVCLNPGAAFGSAKLWPAGYFAELARRLVDQRGSSVLVLCGPADRDLARRIEGMANRYEVRSLADEPVSLGLAKACVKRADLLVTTDSGPRHFAAAFGTPVVTLFGPTYMAWTDTFFPHEVRMQKRVPCGPCQLRTCPLDHRCMTDLRPDEVFRTAVGLMARCHVEARVGNARGA